MAEPVWIPVAGPMEISATHHYGYHPGEWFEVLDVQWYKGRPCYVVSLGEIYDWWPVYDPLDAYEFRPKVLLSNT
jgi:hypothetical protein